MIELSRAKNVATIIVFPILAAANLNPVTAATGLDSEIDTWTDGVAPDGFTDCTNEATEIGTTGIYSLSLTQTEMNNDYIVIQVKTSTVGAVTTVIGISTRNLLTEAMTESYHADGSPPTVAQALHFLIAATTEFAISGTTITAKKLDGSTTAFTLTINSATAPTSVTRAS